MDRQAEQHPLPARRQELIDRANERGIDWDAAIQDLPEDDDKAAIFTLATLLGINIWDALDASKPLHELELEAARLEREEQTAMQTRIVEARRLEREEQTAIHMRARRS